MCHIGRTGSEDSETILSDNRIKHTFHNTLPDDPSIQESFECFFMAQQESMLNEQQKSQKQQEERHQQQQQPQVDTVHVVTNQTKQSDGSVADNDDPVDHSQYMQTPPSMIHQSLLKNRSISRLPIQFQRDVISRSPRSSMQQQQQPEAATTNMFQQRIPPPDHNDISNGNKNSINCLHTKDDSTDQGRTTSATHTTTNTSTAFATKSSCICCQRPLPLLEPDHWPQRPLLLRPTPNSGTRIRGIRFVSSSKEYLWQEDQHDSESLTWPQALRKHWEKDTDSSKLPPPTPTSPNPKNRTMCSQCMILPINNGKELPGESLVSDFESELFIGTILVRLKDCHGTTIPNQIREQTNGGYFHGLHRRYQVVIRGQFKQSLPWTECIAGFQLERPCGKLPPKWIVNGALNVVRFFAPQLQTSITGPRPYSLTPLGSTPQSLIVHDIETDDTADDLLFSDRLKCDVTMEVPQEEPRVDTNTLIGHASNASSSMQRARYRKKHFDKMYADAHHHHHHHQPNTSNKSLQPEGASLHTDTTKVYTFEFLQHLLSFDDFTIELGSIVGSVPLKNILHGQPLQVMSSYQKPIPLSASAAGTTATNATSVSDSNPNLSLQNRFWCFDIWHEMLYADAKAYDEAQHQGTSQPEQKVSHDDEDNVFCQISP